MRPLSILEHFNTLKDIVSSSSIYLILLIIGSLIVLFISTTTKINAKFKRKFYVFAYLLTITTIIAVYYKDLLNMLDYLMNNLFVIFYFPNLACYLVALVITHIILCTTTLNGKENTTLKVVNSIVFVIIHYLLILLLFTITKNKLDVFSQKSIYTNEQAISLITLSSIIFIAWMIFIVIYKLVRSIIYRKKGMELNQVVVYTNKEVEKKETTSPIRPTEAPAFITIPYVPKPAITPTITERKPVIIPVNQEITHKEPSVVKQTPIAEKFTEKPKKSKETLAYEETLTLEDYKLLLSLLKAEKEKMKEEVRDVVIDDSKYHSRRNDTSNVQAKLGELQDLYRSIS